LPFVFISNQMNTIHIVIRHFFMVHFNIIPSMSMFSRRNSISYIVIPNLFITIYSLISYPNSFYWRVGLHTIKLLHFEDISNYLLLLSHSLFSQSIQLNIQLSNNSLKLCSSRGVRDKIS
jgi:hypothetical protein